MSIESDTAMRRTRDEFLASMARQIEPTHPFSYIVLGSEVKVAGEWCQVVALRPDMMRLSPESDRDALFWCVPNTGERFLVADPF